MRSIVKGALLLLFLQIAMSAYGLSQDLDYSERIEELQRLYGDANPDHKIIYLDRVILNKAFKSAGVDPSDGDNPAQRNQIIQEYVKDRIGDEIDSKLADSMGDYFQSGQNVAFIEKDLVSNKTYCTIVPSNPDLSAKEESERVLYWNLLKSKQEYLNKKIQKKFSKKQTALMADIHESFHCLDPYYLPKASSLELDQEVTRHKAETYAEVAALLTLALQGHDDLVELRAMYRVVGSFMAGRYTDEFGPNLTPELNPGVIYSFYPSLFEVQKRIDAGLPKMNLSEAQKLAFEITESTSLNEYQIHAVSQYQRNPDVLLYLIEDFTNSTNQALKERFEKIEEALEVYLEILDWAFEGLLGLDQDETQVKGAG